MEGAEMSYDLSITIYESIPTDNAPDLTNQERAIIDSFNAYIDFVSPIKSKKSVGVPLSWDERLIHSRNSDLDVMLNGAVLAGLILHGVEIGLNESLGEDSVNDLLEKHDPDGKLAGDAYELLIDKRLKPMSSACLNGWVTLQIKLLEAKRKLMEVKLISSKAKVQALEKDGMLLRQGLKYQKTEKNYKDVLNTVFRLSASKGWKSRITMMERIKVIRGVIESNGFDCFEFEPHLGTLTVESIWKECVATAPDIFEGVGSLRSFRNNCWNKFREWRKTKGT